MTKKKRIVEGDDEEEDDAQETTVDTEGERKKKKKNRDNETEEEKSERRERKREKKKAKKGKDGDKKKKKHEKSKKGGKGKAAVIAEDSAGDAEEEEREIIMKKKRKNTVQEEDEEEEQAEEEEEEPLDNLPELQKEAILYDRQMKRKEKEDREAAKRKLQIEQKNTRSSAREVKKPALSKALEVYAALKTGQEKSKDDDESTDDEAPKKSLDAESSEEELQEEAEEPEKPASEEEEEEDGDDQNYSEVSCKQIVSNLQVRRVTLEKIFGEPWFKDYIVKKFVRLNLGERADTGQMAYRMAEIIDVKSYPRPYKFGNNRSTQLALLVRHGKADRIFAMTVVSNGSITESEVERWKKEMIRVNERILSSEDALVIKKSAEFHRTSFKYTPDIVQELLDKKKRENLKTFNLTAERNKLMHARAMAQENGDTDEVARLQSELEYLDNEEGMIRRRKGAYKAGLVALNIRNKERNLLAREQIHKEINKAERVSGKLFQQEDYYSTKMTFPAQIWTAPEKDEDRLKRFDQSQAELAKKKQELEEANRVKQRPKPSALVLTDPVEEEKKAEIQLPPELDHGAIFKSVSPSDIAYLELVDKHNKIHIDTSLVPQRPIRTTLLHRVPVGDFRNPRSLRDYLEEIGR